MSGDNNFVDILRPRNTQFGIIRFMTRSWSPKKTLVLDKSYKPQELKDLVANSVFMDTYLNAESARQGVSVEKLRKEMLGFLDEMAFEKKIHVVRWVGIAFLKICFMMHISVYVNEPVVHKLKATMGNNPVLFLPTHRSYADFCLMTYLCYHYDIDLPAVAAGMDFHSMVIVGQRMREICAFYIRRSLIGAPLYAATLKQYVRTVVAHHSAPLEFFLEGTRSRSNKSMYPRFGMLSMALLPYFAREVTDVTIVPVNISYDRIAELTLFAYEHLGVPKPRESTEGLIKSLQSLKDHYGNVYVNMGTPISVNEYLKQRAPSADETLKPVELQALTAQQRASVRSIARHVVACQQDCTVLTMPALLSMVVMQSVVKNRSLHLDEVLEELQWLVGVLESLGARAHDTDLRAGVERMLLVHRRMFTLDADNHLKLISSALMNVTGAVQRRMKGHKLKAETMVNAVPIIELQTYMNSVLHYLVPSALIYLVATGRSPNIEKCQLDYELMRMLLRGEFFYTERNENKTFKKALEFCVQQGALVRDGDELIAGANERLQYLLQWILLPTLTTLSCCVEIMAQTGQCAYVRAMQLVQAAAERRAGHPYSLSLEAAGNCLRSMLDCGVLQRNGTENPVAKRDLHFEAVPEQLEAVDKLVQAVTPPLHVNFGVDNCVIAARASVASRL